MSVMYASKAGDTLNRIERRCRLQTGLTNVFFGGPEEGDWRQFMFEETDYKDGGIQGTVSRMVGESACVQEGRFSIDRDGKIVRFYKLPKEWR